MEQRTFIFEIGDFLVSSEILTECFCCDYEKCGGCCCIIGDSGAPVEENEIPLMKENFANYSPYLTAKGIREIERQGFAIRDYDNDLVTPLVENRECAYCCFDEKDNCFCAIECNRKRIPVQWRQVQKTGLLQPLSDSRINIV